MYGKIIEHERIKYFTPYKGGLLLNDRIIINPSEAQYNEAGWYEIINIEDDGFPYISSDNKLLNFIGKPYVQSEYDKKQEEIKIILNNTEELTEAIERLIAVSGVTLEDRLLAQQRIALRDELGKIIQTEEGDGSDMNPYIWKGQPIISGMWYKTPSGYIWEAIKDGIPSSEIDNEYFDVIGI